jgi:RimJ/RimL family protein N-acetyltransferase
VLREWSEPDLPHLPALFDHESIDKWTPLRSPFDDAAATDYLAGARQARETGAGIQLAITADGRTPVGEVLLFGCDGDASAGEFAYALGPSFRGLGYASRAVALVIPWAAEVLQLRTLRALISSQNEPSRRVAEANGFAPFDGPLTVRRRKGREVVLATWERPATAAL